MLSDVKARWLVWRAENRKKPPLCDVFDERIGLPARAPLPEPCPCCGTRKPLRAEDDYSRDSLYLLWLPVLMSGAMLLLMEVIA